MTTKHMQKKINYNFSVSARKSAGYTVTTADEHLVATAALTFTLPATSTYLEAGKGAKVHVFENEGASTAMTIASNAADTIDGDLTTIAITGTGYIVLVLDSVNNNWVLGDDMPYLYTENLRDGSVTTAKLADDAITNAKIGALAVDTAEIALDAIDGTLIEDDAVDSEHIAAGAIDPEHFAALSVETAAIAAANVTGAKSSLTANYGHVTIDTSSTDPQTFASIPVAVTITNVTAVSEDTTAANLVVKNGTTTVCTIAKGTIASGGSGAFTLANTALGAAGAMTAESSVTNGDGKVTVHFSATA